MSGGFHVMSRMCDQCLLSPERIVSNGRAAEILKQCAREDTHFLCHKGTMAGRDIGCRAHYDRAPGRVPRFAQWLGLVTEIDPDTLEPVPCDSGSVPQGENSRSEVEGEATQSGRSDSEGIAQPNPGATHD
jgi:hypothetical protein